MSRTQLSAFIKRYTITVWVRLYGELLTRLTSSMIQPFMIIYLQDKMDGSVLMTMAVVGLQPLTDIVVTLLAGGLADRLGRKPVLIGSLGLQMLAMAGMMFAHTVWMFALLYVCNGAGRSFYIPAARAQISDAVPDDQRGEVFALLSTVSNAGAIIGPLIGYMLYRYNPSVSFALSSLALLLYLLTIWWKLPETAPPVHAPNESVDASFGAVDNVPPSIRPPYQILLTLMVLSLPISLFYAQVETNFQLHLKNNFVDYLSILTWLSTSKGILVICTQLLLVKRTEHVPLHKLVFIGYLCYAGVAISYGYAHTFALLLLAQVALTVAECFGITMLLNYVSLLAPPHMRGRCFSLYGIHWDISRTLGPYAGGLLFLHGGGNLLFSVVAVLLLIGGIAQSEMIKRIESRQQAQAM